MDCSEFTAEVYGQATGVWMPSDYVAQRYYGTPVYGELKRGDLLLYADGVAIYWGDGQALMSSHYYYSVEIIDMDDLYGYLGARRIRWKGTYAVPGYLTKTVLMGSDPQRLDRLLNSYVKDCVSAGTRPGKIYAELYSAYRIVLKEGGSNEQKDVILTAIENLQKMQ
jgi:hypothetical protein